MKAWDLVREHPRATAVAACVATALGLGSYAAGRWGAPTKVEVREREVTVYKADEKAVAKAVSDARTTWEREVKDNTRIVTKYVEGKVVERVEYRDRDTTSSGGKVETKTVEVIVEKKVEVIKEVEKERIVTRDAPRWTLGATVGTGIQGGALQPPAWGGLVGYRLVGPLGVQLALEGNAVQFSGRAGLTLQF